MVDYWGMRLLEDDLAIVFVGTRIDVSFLKPIVDLDRQIKSHGRVLIQVRQWHSEKIA